MELQNVNLRGTLDRTPGSDRPRYTLTLPGPSPDGMSSRELIDVSDDVMWAPVVMIERVIGPLGTITSITHHKTVRFEERISQLEEMSSAPAASRTGKKRRKLFS